MNASELASLQFSLALVKQRFQAIVGDSRSKAWLVHVHDKGDATPPIYALADGYESYSAKPSPSDLSYCGVPATGLKDSRFQRCVRLNGDQRLLSIGADTARLLVLLPAAVQSRLWRGLPAGTVVTTVDLALWVLAVFELANANIDYSSLRAGRVIPIEDGQVWSGGSGPRFRDLADSDWYATLPDFAAASVQAIDILQSWLAAAPKGAAEVKPLAAPKVEGTAGDDVAETIKRVPLMLGGDGGKIMAIVNHPTLTTDQKLRALGVDERFKGYKSDDLAKMLGVSPASIRNSDAWREWNPKRAQREKLAQK